MHCAPAAVGVYKKTKSCLTLEYLRLVARNYNEAHPEAEPIRLSKRKRDLLVDIRRRTGVAEHLWAELPYMKPASARKVEGAFRPKKPCTWAANEYEWLNTTDIEDVMRQYEAKYPRFRFIAVTPMDFAARAAAGQCVDTRMCRLDAAALLREGVKSFAVVLNLDKHDQAGSHWVALHCGLDPRRKTFGVWYYDSIGTPPTREVRALAAKIAKQLQAIVRPVTFAKFQTRYNRTRKQAKNTECGVYALRFIECCIEGKRTFEDICSKMGDDAAIHKFRETYYRPNKCAR